jgi:hypothetical protein
LSGASRKRKARAQATREDREQRRRERDARREGGLLPREEETRKPYTRILIVCEGERTEPNYFVAFPIRSGDVVTVRGVGMNTDTLVKKTIELRDADGDYDEVWAVFDRDSFPLARYKRAFALAMRESIRVAYTNEAFELWYLMHFEYCDAARSRVHYEKPLSGYLGRPYKKKATDIYDLLLEHQPTAIRNAERLVRHHRDLGAILEQSNPSTSVHRLVQRLIELSRR